MNKYMYCELPKSIHDIMYPHTQGRQVGTSILAYHITISILRSRYVYFNYNTYLHAPTEVVTLVKSPAQPLEFMGTSY